MNFIIFTSHSWSMTNCDATTSKPKELKDKTSLPFASRGNEVEIYCTKLEGNSWISMPSVPQEIESDIKFRIKVPSNVDICECIVKLDHPAVVLPNSSSVQLHPNLKVYTPEDYRKLHEDSDLSFLKFTHFSKKEESFVFYLKYFPDTVYGNQHELHFIIGNLFKTSFKFHPLGTKS